MSSEAGEVHYVDQKNRLTFHWDGGKIVLRTNCNHDIIKNP